MQDLTVCINYFNNMPAVEKVARSVGKDYRVVVVDSGSTPDNVLNAYHICKELGADLYIFAASAKYVGHPNQANLQVYGSKNWLLQFIETPYVIFNDGDFVYTDGAIEESLIAFQKLPNTGLLGYYNPAIAGVLDWDDAGWPDQLSLGHRAVGIAAADIKGTFVGFTEVNTVGGASTLHKTSILRELGGWPTPKYPRYKCPPGVCGTGDGLISDVVHNAGLKMYIPTDRVWGHFV
jgi:cellulose synthase/poly-beta-1,6-N-acetylglucosamine synthase-like glycosyltransferase